MSVDDQIKAAISAGEMDRLTGLIEGWAWERNLIDGSSPQAQMLKMVEELGELAGGISRGKEDVIVDSLGDVFVVWTILCNQLGCDPAFVVAEAWNEIKDRKGRMVNGVFIKEGD